MLRQRGRAKARNLTYSARVKANCLLLSAACALCLPCLALSGCRSDAQSPVDAAVTEDASAATDLSTPAVDGTAEVLTTVTETATAIADGPGDASRDEASPADAPGYDTSGEAGCDGWTALKRLSPAEVSDLLATTDPIVINVHIPYAGDIPGTDTSIPYNNVDAIEAFLNYDHCADVLLVCLTGGMSQSAGNELVKRGYLRVRDLNGGMQAWQAAGYTLLKDGGS